MRFYMKTKFFLAAVLLSCFAFNLKADDIPRSEYPRPQFERADWINLNGEWDYTFDFSETGQERGFCKAESFEGKIIVPFCPESILSGVGYKDFINCIWYRRDISIPENWKGKKILLNFGAVYYTSEIYIDGTLVKRHFGGSSSFSADITAYVSDGQPHNLIVRATSDLRSKTQGAGKQSLQYGSYGCNYTRTTGIWQTVWMEAVAPEALMDAKVVTDVDQSRIVISPRFFKDSKGTLKVTLKDGTKTVATASVAASNNSVIVLPVKKAKLWSPESPFLYDLEYTLTDESGTVADHVKSYVGMRKIHIDGNKIYLNGKPCYQRLVLDQGFYPDGIWTAPTDSALKRDIELSMAAGFNGARLHQKVFEERFYYWADKLGYITWGEAPSWGMDANNMDAARNFLSEWREIVARDRNHPSLLIWTPLNEEWWPDAVQYPRFVADLYDLTKLIDPTRPVNDASGGTHIKTDIWTIHNYEQNPFKLKNIIYYGEKFFATPVYPQVLAPANIGFNGLRPDEPYGYPAYDGSMPLLIDEVGGIKWAPESADTTAWGYGVAPRTKTEFLDRLAGQINSVLQLGDHVWGYCYTQLTDVEQEQNGIYNYDRTPKFAEADMAEIHSIFSKEPDDVKGMYQNPILPYGPDPCAYWYNGYYYYMHTMVDKIVLWRTKDITDLSSAEQKTIWVPSNPDGKYNVWAPEITRIDGKWYVHYAADDGNSDNHQMFVIENSNDDPFEGEFVFKGRISTDKDNNWAIDGSLFEHNGELYMVWSGWQTRRIDTETQCIYIAKMENPWTLASERVLISKPEMDWERNWKNENGWNPAHIVYVNEGPQPLKDPDGKHVHIVYSASGVWTPYYSLGLLTADADADLLDPASWKKADKPVFTQSPENGVYGTGHNFFFTSPDGKESYLIYHARSAEVDLPGMGDMRSPRIQKFEWTEDGYPEFGTPLPTRTWLPKPSGTENK